MISFRNALLRESLRLLFNFLAKVIAVENFFLRRRKQPRLQGKTSSYDDLSDSLQRTFEKMSNPKFWALTSGTTSLPKKIPYDKTRRLLIQKTFLKSMITLTSGYSGRKTFFVFSSLDQDDSLTSGLIQDMKKPSHIELLQAPYRFFQIEEGRRLRQICGDLSARVILLVVTCPRHLYGTNPSTLTYFFSQVSIRWPEIQKSIDLFFKDIKLLKSVLALQDGDGRSRLEKIRSSDKVDLFEITSKVQSFISWDGGYVGIFLEQLKILFPRIDQIPMFSMSTEGLETLPHKIRGRIHFFSIAPSTYSEFLDQDSDRILSSHELEEGRSYTLLISDRWGLNRYDTQDIFLVKEIIDGHPDLQFQRRRGRTSSVTGEKLTEAQVLLMGEQLKEQFPELMHTSLSLYPCVKNGCFFYKLFIIGKINENTDNLSNAGEAILKNINSEYKNKVESGRILPLLAIISSELELARIMGRGDNWESQFKVLPLYEKIIRED